MGLSRDSNADEANPSKNQQPFTEQGSLERISNLFLVHDDVEYRIGRKIGEGSFGVLFEGERLSGGNSIPVAIKFCWKIGEKKQNVPIQELCEGFPPELAEYLGYVRKLGFEDAPDYEYLQGLFVRALEDAGLSDDGIFDWMDAGDAQLKEPEIRLPPGPSEAGLAPSSPRRKERRTADSILPRRGPLGWPEDANVDLPSAH
ncbi:hypothetical protein V8F33_013985 [Rhypophila sp. PSN 637]